MCFRSLAELTIENPPTSSTFTFGRTGAEMDGGGGEGGAARGDLDIDPHTFCMREAVRIGALSASGPGAAGGGRLRFFFVFFWVSLEQLLDDDDDPEPLGHLPPSDPYPSQSGMEIQPSSWYCSTSRSAYCPEC